MSTQPSRGDDDRYAERRFRSSPGVSRLAGIPQEPTVPPPSILKGLHTASPFATPSEQARLFSQHLGDPGKSESLRQAPHSIESPRRYPYSLNSKTSPGWHSSALQTASSVENRIALAFPFFNTEMLAIVMPTFSASSVTLIFRLASMTSMLMMIAMRA